MGFITSVCKWILFITNFLIFVSHISLLFWTILFSIFLHDQFTKVLSCAALGLGIWILADRSSFLDLLDTVQVSALSTQRFI